MKKFLCMFIILGIPLCSFSQVKKESVAASKPVKAATANAVPVKKVSFVPNRRNPFLSKEEVRKIEEQIKADQRRREAEAEARERAAKAEQERLLKEQMLKEELERYPARAVMYKISVDGILGKEAIVNGEVVAIGDKVLDAKIISITDDSVWFVYKGQRFERKLPLL